MRRRLGARAITSSVALSLLTVVACDKKPRRSAPPPEITGLAAVPASAVAVIGVDVTKAAESELVDHAIEQLLLRDVTLAGRWTDLQTHCKIDIRAQVHHLMLALGPPPPEAQTGSGPIALIATGKLSEPELVACLPKLVGAGGGGISTQSVSGRSLYEVKDGNRALYFSFGRNDTVVFGTTVAWVVEALGSGSKALDDPTLSPLLARVDQRATLWAVGKIDPNVGKGLVAASDGGVTSAPQAIVATVDPRTGLKAELAVVMPTEDAAKQLESFARKEWALLTTIAQLRSLGSLVAKVTMTREGTRLAFRATLDQAEVNQLLSVLDEKPSPAQGSPPPTRAGSGSGT